MASSLRPTLVFCLTNSFSTPRVIAPDSPLVMASSPVHNKGLQPCTIKLFSRRARIYAGTACAALLKVWVGVAGWSLGLH